VNIPGNVRIVGFFGRIAYTKGIDILIRAACKVIESDQMVHFLLVGSSRADDLEVEWEIEDILHRSHILANWHRLGYQERVQGLMRSVNVVVLPSRREAFPLVLLEAALAGKPVVASRVGGITEMVLDGETGVLVPPEDPTALADALIALLSQPVLAAEMGCRAREHVLRCFPPERFRDEFLALYDIVCGESGSETFSPSLISSNAGK
jgi:glycosyltransferase involved in cell wall biosynthesis